jgi:hypothetical protein
VDHWVPRRTRTLPARAGLICTLLLAGLYFFIDQAKWRFAVLLLIAVLISINLYILAPEIFSLRESAGNALQKGTETYSRFALLHGIASGLYLLVSLFGLLLVIRQPDKVGARPNETGHAEIRFNHTLKLAWQLDFMLITGAIDYYHFANLLYQFSTACRTDLLSKLFT